MAMVRRTKQQEHLLLPTARSGGHRFYEALSKLLDEAGFDAKVEAFCAPHDVPQGDASMRSIVRKDTGERYQENIKHVTAKDEAATATAADSSDGNDLDPPSAPSSVVAAAAAATPEPSTVDKAPRKVTAEQAVRHDRKRKKTTSNDDWASSTDGSAMTRGERRIGSTSKRL